MENQIESKINDYDVENPFNNFRDSLKFKYNDNGDICISTDKTSWVRVLLNNMKLDDYFQSENTVPVLSFPCVQNKINCKSRKKAIQDNLELCEICDSELDLDRYIYQKKIVCCSCIDKISSMCSICKTTDSIRTEKIKANLIIKKWKIYVYIDTGKSYNLEYSDYYCKSCYREYVDDEYDRCSNCGIECESDRENVITLCRECKIWG
jgi:hypothetical protein